MKYICVSIYRGLNVTVEEVATCTDCDNERSTDFDKLMNDTINILCSSILL